MSEAVDNLHSQLAEISAMLTERDEPTLQTTLDRLSAKALVVAAASEFEVALSSSIRNFADERMGYKSVIGELIQSKAISRQYHTWFDWNNERVTPFFALFGKGFSAFMRARLEADRELSDGAAAFVSLGNTRNSLAHQDFANFDLPGTAKEIYDQYIIARKFVFQIPELLREFDNTLKESSEADDAAQPQA